MRSMWMMLGLSAAVMVSSLGRDDDDGPQNTGGQGPTCGSQASPELLELIDIQPAAGSTVENTAIVHGFTIVDAPPIPAQMELNFLLPAPQHSAGNPVGMLRFWVTPQGANTRFESEPFAWTSAPANVYMHLPDPFEGDGESCWYSFPESLFDYAIIPGAGGSGAGGGSGGGGGEAGAGGGGGEAGGGGAGGAGGAAGGG